MTADEVEEPISEALPTVVRAKVVILAADALGRMPESSLPTSLKRVAQFNPNRRARLAGSQIAAALESDAEFRASLALHVRAAEPELAAAVESGLPPPAADPTDVAAFAYLLRPRGWHSMVTVAAKASSVERANEAEQRSAVRAESLERQLEAATQELKSERRRHRADLARMKAENADLRRKLGDVRGRLRSAEADAAKARDEFAVTNRDAADRAAAGEAELRRLRSRLEELESSLGERRRVERVARHAEGIRARLLLDTLLESAQGLRRELALPAAEASPADLLAAELARDLPEPSPEREIALDDPVRLNQVLALPRSHLIVDGYNVTMAAWPASSLDRQRDRLLGGLAALAARTAAEVTVVFDAAEKARRPLVNQPRGIRVLFSPAGVIADDVIRELVAAEPRGRPVVVVSDDREIARDVSRSGARVADGTALVGLLSRA